MNKLKLAFVLGLLGCAAAPLSKDAQTQRDLEKSWVVCDRYFKQLGLNDIEYSEGMDGCLDSQMYDKGYHTL